MSYVFASLLGPVSLYLSDSDRDLVIKRFKPYGKGVSYIVVMYYALNVQSFPGQITSPGLAQ